MTQKVNNIRLGFEADDALAIRQAGSSTPLLMRWTIAPGPGFGGPRIYTSEFSLGCTKADFELVTSGDKFPNDFYELSVFWIASPGSNATQAELDAQPRNTLDGLMRFKSTCDCTATSSGGKEEAYSSGDDLISQSLEMPHSAEALDSVETLAVVSSEAPDSAKIVS